MNAICQLIASPMVNDPSGWALHFLGKFLAKDRSIVAGCTVTDFKKFGNAEETIFGCRNFITVCDDVGDPTKSEETIVPDTGVLPVVVNDDLGQSNIVPVLKNGKVKSGKLIASLYLEPWKEKPFYRTVNKFCK